VKVIAPTRLLVEAATVLEPIRDEVVVIGALAVQIALDGHDVALTPTGDVDAGVETEAVDRVVAHLEKSGLRRSAVTHERSFTWVKDDLKVQLLRPFHPFPKGAASGLPTNNLVSELVDRRRLISFTESPAHGRFWVATPAALIGLKEAAFGRTRPSGQPVDRDFSDVALMLDRLPAEIVGELSPGEPMHARVLRAAHRLADEDKAVAAAARELVRAGYEETQLAAEASVRRVARDASRLLA
jgi:hypothetical protein